MAAVSSPDLFKLGFIGAGNMAESIARGVAKSGLLHPSSIRTAHRRAVRRDVFRSFGVEILESNAQVLQSIFCCVPSLTRFLNGIFRNKNLAKWGTGLF